MPITPDPDLDEYLQRWTGAYEGANYDQGLAAWFLRRSHLWCEQAFGPERRFDEVVEVGAGTGVHIDFVRHAFRRYLITDLSTGMLDRVGAGRRRRAGEDVIVRNEDATQLSFENARFDRLIATHVLEHLPRPHEVLKEWARVVRPGGVISIVLPCDPGIAWRLGRSLGPRRKFKALGIDYDYWMSREHINPVNNLVNFIRYYFSRVDESWFPMRVPSIDANLFYIAHATV
jgi:ubiquinone/menaquinone biosynthesis C-methylase UbiE